jgi:hypothetical protein
MMNGLRKCGIYTQWNFIHSQKKNEILSFAVKWTEQENIIIKDEKKMQKKKVRLSQK